MLLAVAACGDDDDSASDEDETAVENAADLLGPEDPAEGEPVRIGMITDGQTPNFDNRDEARSAEAAAEFWNERRGGVGGQPVEVVVCETVADPATATDCGNQMVEQEVVAVALSQSAVTEQVWEPINEAGIPMFLLQASGEELAADDETTFLMTNPTSTLFGIPVTTAEEEGADHIAFVTIDVPVALTQFESVGPTVLENAGMDYDLVRIPPGTADMTSQMGEVANSDAGVAHVVGNDAFCVAAFNGLAAVGFEGAITAVSQCITDATREGVPEGGLEGIRITATMAVGDTEDSAYQLYQAVMGEYGDDVEDVENALAMGGYTVMSSLLASLEGIEGDITPENVAETIRTMDETEYPGADGVTFQCGGSAFESLPAVCTNQSLAATLDAEGNPASYEAVDFTDLLEGL
ncbi:MAG TPA: ABC transporter substrate-binding protein [Acidimicrobiales bacterium]